MKRVILGSLLSCMLVGQVFGVDRQDSATNWTATAKRCLIAARQQSLAFLSNAPLGTFLRGVFGGALIPVVGGLLIASEVEPDKQLPTFLKSTMLVGVGVLLGAGGSKAFGNKCLHMNGALIGASGVGGICLITYLRMKHLSDKSANRF